MFDTINLAFTKGYFILYNENKITFCFKKGCFIGPQNQRFRLKKGCFLAQNPRKGGIFQAWVRVWYTFWSRVGGPGHYDVIAILPETTWWRINIKMPSYQYRDSHDRLFFLMEILNMRRLHWVHERYSFHSFHFQYIFQIIGIECCFHRIVNAVWKFLVWMKCKLYFGASLCFDYNTVYILTTLYQHRTYHYRKIHYEICDNTLIRVFIYH